MEKSKQSVSKKHKTQILIGGLIAFGLAGSALLCYLLLKDKEPIPALPKGTIGQDGYLPRTPEIKAVTETKPVIETTDNASEVTRISNVNGFLRTLPKNHKASPIKQEEAKRMGIILSDNQTIVDSFTRKIVG